MKRWLSRFLVGMILAVPMVVLSVALAKAGPASGVAAAPQISCLACHSEFQAAWEMGAHANATYDTVFQEAWEAQGSPGACLECHVTGYDDINGTWDADGITCQACHSPAPDNHPQEPMPIDRSAKFCGDCHTDTYFDWQASEHRLNKLGCISCHDPHATELKSGDPSGLCATCHGLTASGFAHSEHSGVGMTCADCHMETLDVAEVGGGHALRDHSFHVRLSTCNMCHAYQMHASQDATPQAIEPHPTDAMAAVEEAQVSLEPNPVSPIGFATLSGLIGMATGMILAPWLERWYRRMRKDDE